MCPHCRVGFHSMCDTNCNCHSDASLLYSPEPEEEDEDEGRRSNRSRNESSRTGKRTSSLKDEQSTGRKRAARMYPLDREAPCDWLNKDNCGGGLFPVLGCLDGKQQARHHGPDKNVINNEEGNVHRICHACHYRWHVANDPTYDWNKTDYPSHAPCDMPEHRKPQAALNRLMTQGNRRIKD